MRACEVTFTCLTLLLLTPAARPIRVVIQFLLRDLAMIIAGFDVVLMNRFPLLTYIFAMWSLNADPIPTP